MSIHLPTVIRRESIGTPATSPRRRGYFAGSTVVPPPIEGRTTYLPQLDSLRGVACLMVLIAHMKSVEYLHWVPDIIGVAGVGVFFALSGFLITRILIADRAAGRGLRAFYDRRVARIFPIYYLTLGLLVFFCRPRELRWAANFSFNFRFLAEARDYFQVDGSGLPPVAHFWSLCVEEHFYWVWPWLVMFLPLSVARRIPQLIVAATPLIAWQLHSFLEVFGFSESEVEGLLGRLTLTQLVALAVGAWAAFNEAWLSQSWIIGNRISIRRSSLCGGLMVTAGVAWSALFRDSSMAAATAATALHLTCGGLFLFVLGIPQLGRLRLLCAVGTISYGLYLYHLPIYTALGLTQFAATSSVWTGCLAALLTVICAAASYRWLESPIIELVRKWQRAETGRAARAFSYARASLTAVVGVVFLVALGRNAGTLVEYAQEAVPSWSGEAFLGGTPDRKPSVSPETIVAIVVGSSHGEMAICAADCKAPTYNLAFVRQDLWYDCGIVHCMLERLPQLKRVVFCVSSFSFRCSQCDDRADGRWMEALYYHVWRIPSQKDYSRRHRYNLITAPIHAADMARMRLKARLIDDPLRGWRAASADAKPVDEDFARRVAERHESFGRRRTSANREVLIRTIQDCQARGIECVLVTTPLHAYYRRYLPENSEREFLSHIQLVMEKTGVRHLNYAADDRFGAADFSDGDHVNPCGAAKFTKILEADLPSAQLCR